MPTWPVRVCCCAHVLQSTGIPDLKTAANWRSSSGQWTSAAQCCTHCCCCCCLLFSSSSLAYIFIPLLLSLPTQLLQYGGAKDRTWAGRAHCTATQRTWRQAFRLGRWGKPSDVNRSHSRSDLLLVGTLLLLVSQAIFDSPQLECRKYILFYINLVCIWTYQSCIDSCKRTVGKHVGLAEREQDRPVSRSNQWQQIATSVSSSRVFIDIGRQCHRRTRRRRVCLEDIPMDGRQLLAQDRCWWMPCLYWTTGIRWIYIYTTEMMTLLTIWS